MKINNKEKVVKVREFLKCFCEIGRSQQNEFLKDCSNVIILCISEACFNLLNNKHLKNKQHVVNKTRKIKRQMKWLSDPAQPFSKKRALLLKPEFGDILFSVIGDVLVPFLHKLLKNEK